MLEVITISEFVVIGLIEVFAVLLLAVGLLLFLNHRLHAKGGSLSTQLRQLKETTKFLLDKVNEHGKQTYSFFLGKAVEEAKAESEDLLDSSDLQFTADQTEQDKASVMRYLLLEAELAAENEENVQAKVELRAAKLKAIVQDIEAVHTPIPESKAGSIELDEADLKQKWGYLCEAAVDLVVNRTMQSAEDLIEIIQVVNSDLGLTKIDLPERARGGDVSHVQEESDRTRDVIAQLLAERNAAEAEVQIQVSELERLQRFLKESEMVITQLEGDFNNAQQEIEKLRSSGDSEDPAEMQELIKRFTQESSEMLICIETLEQENSDLKHQLGLQ